MVSRGVPPAESMADRESVFENLANFRQAGGRGLTNRLGQRIRDGLLFRSSRPDFVTPRDKILLQQLGIRTIIDLRSPEEYQSANGEKLADESYQLCALRGGETVSIGGKGPLANRKSFGRHYLLSLWTREMVSHSIRLVWKNCLLRWMVIFMLVLLWICDKAFGTFRFARFFVRFVVNKYSSSQQYVLVLEHGKPVVASILRHLLQPGSLPVLINCSYGRDRTGVLVAVILGCLEVEEDIIAEDYAKSEVNKYTVYCLKIYVKLDYKYCSTRKRF